MSTPPLLHRIASRLGYTPTVAVDARVRAIRASAGAVIRQQRSFLAALTTPDVASWSADAEHINVDTASGLATTRARSRAAARNDGTARRFLGMVHSNVLGPWGVRYQSRVRTGGGALKSGVNDRLEAAWATWGRAGVCEVTARHGWRTVQRLVLRHVAVDGEVLVRFLSGRGPHRLQLQIIRADAIAISLNMDLPGGRRIRQGIELDADGRVLAWHLRTVQLVDLHGESSAGYPAGLTRLPADEAIHLMLPEEADQLRGVPWMATALKKLHQVDDFAQSGLNKARQSARRGGWFEVAPDAPMPPPMQDGTDEDGTAFATVQDGDWETLPAGLKATPFENEYPNIEYGAFVRDCLRQVASALGTAYITLGNDLSDVNYSSGQLGLEGERTFWAELQQWFIESFVQPVHRRWLSHALLAVPELVTLPFDRLDLYAQTARWQPHRWQPLDPLKTIEAQRARIEARLTSPQRVIAEAGDDPDEVLAELIEWQAKTEPLGPMVHTPVTSTDPVDAPKPSKPSKAPRN
ncbi:phage portal protein [Leptothrix discophora]|uniref:Phage portal protein n=1 Tax=Leptothrix discophora TaxID=89 RepID=A0ABT9G1I1_LEPDI|nr:phage portal protein [Leptothrix discophora]MDP4300349.1 phage portal protein [Leptothrix discophora]